MFTKTIIRGMVTLTKDKFPKIKRGNYAAVGDADLQYFERILSKNQIITDEDGVKSYNSDWLNMVRGQFIAKIVAKITLYHCNEFSVISKGYSSVVLKPKTTEEVSAILKYCNERRLAVCPQGGNTGLVGGSVPVFDEVIISTALMNKILDFDPLTGSK